MRYVFGREMSCGSIGNVKEKTQPGPRMLLALSVPQCAKKSIDRPIDPGDAPKNKPFIRGAFRDQ